MEWQCRTTGSREPAGADVGEDVSGGEGRLAEHRAERGERWPRGRPEGKLAQRSDVPRGHKARHVPPPSTTTRHILIVAEGGRAARKAGLGGGRWARCRRLDLPTRLPDSTRPSRCTRTPQAVGAGQVQRGEMKATVARACVARALCEKAGELVGAPRRLGRRRSQQIQLGSGAGSGGAHGTRQVVDSLRVGSGEGDRE